MNQTLQSLFEADQQERVDQPKANTPEYKAMRDRQRRERVFAMVAANELTTAEDFFHAAHSMNHGDTIEDAQNAHILALRPSQLGYRSARWLAAAFYDCWQMYQGKPQKYGTNYVFDGREDHLWDVDPGTTEEERARWDVPPLAEQLRKAEEANQQKAFEANAPEWLKQVLKR